MIEPRGRPRAGAGASGRRGAAGLALSLVASVWAALPVNAQVAPHSLAADTIAAGYVSPARPITLAEAVDLAQKRAPAVIQAEGQHRSAEVGVRSSYAAFIPSLSLNAGATRQLPGGQRTRVENGQVITLPSEPWSYGLGLGANLDLFTGGQRLFEIQRARADVRSTAASEVTERYLTTLAVKQQFFNVLAARESETAALAQLDQAEQQMRASVAQVRAHTATRSDSLRSEILVRTARIALSEARTSLEVANASLTRTVGIPDRITASPADTLPDTGLALSAAELHDLAIQGPVVAQTRADLAAAEAVRRSSWSLYLPTVTAGYSRNGNAIGTNLFPNENDAFSYSGSLRLAVSLPVFDQFRREQQMTQADVALDNAKAALRDAQLAAEQNLATALGAYRTGTESVESGIASLEAAQEDLRVQQQRYAVGSSTLLDVLASETTLNQARRDLIRARYDQRVAKAQLEALVGRDL